jgi:prepilin-type N-terminal cleavage/methylation domain-containing protein
MNIYERKRGFSLIELMVAIGIMAVAAIVIYPALRCVSILITKNTGMNYVHQEMRYGLSRLEQDLHLSVSNPQLLNGSGSVISGTGPAAGVSFRIYAGGPYPLYVMPCPAGTTIPSTVTSIKIITGTTGTAADYRPLVGQRIHIQALPTTIIEADITAVSNPPTFIPGIGTIYTLTFGSALGTAIPVYPGGHGFPAAAMSVTCFLSTPVSYLVVPNGTNVQLQRTCLADTAVLVPYLVTSPSPMTTTPFSISTVDGTSNPGFVSVSNFTGSNPTTSALNYNGILFWMNMQTPHWGQLSTNY